MKKQSTKQMTKLPVIREMAKLTNMTKQEASFVYDVINDIMLRAIREGKDVVIPNIGTLRLVEGRTMRSNLTGVTIPPHKRLRFKINVKLARFIRIDTREYPIQQSK